MTAAFRLHHLTIGARGDDAALCAIAADILQYKGADPVDDPGDDAAGARAAGRSGVGLADDSSIPIKLTFSKVPVLPPLPEGAERVGAFGPDLDTYRKDRRFLLAGPNSRLDVHLERGSAAAYFHADRLDAAAPEEAIQRIYYPLTFGLTILLREHGLFGLHAGAIERDGRGVLLAASSDSGKTTATLALVRQGWRYVSDDALLLRQRGDRVEALSFRRDFALDEEALDHFPELRGVTWPRSPSDPSKLRVDVEVVRPGAFVSACTPTALILPNLTGDRESRLVEVDRLGAFEHLMAQSALNAAPVPDRIGAQMNLLAALIQQVRIFRLDAGRDVLEDPEAFSRRVSPLL